MNIAFYGSSLVSSYWNGAATYYRGMLEQLAACGHAITFHEPDAFERQSHRDIEPPPYARVNVWDATPDGLARALAHARDADVVVKASGVGVYDDELLDGLCATARSDALMLFWDVDAPATLAAMHTDPSHAVRRALPRLDAVLTYGGGDPVVDDYLAFGARACVPVYNALDPLTHKPAQAEPGYAATLSLLANRLPDREARIGTFFLDAARAMPEAQFILGGAGWHDAVLPSNVRALGHVPTNAHNAFNCSALAVLNVARDSMAEVGFSPATRVFEAAGAGACIITDAWRGIELFLEPGEEILVARDGAEVAAHLRALTPERARAIGLAARARVLRDHTYARRGAQVDVLLRALIRQRRQAA